MLLLSFDVGIKNLAYCLTEYIGNCFYIQEFALISLQGSDLNSLAKSLLYTLSSRKHLHQANTVVIELQLLCNPQVKTLSNMIYFYYIMTLPPLSIITFQSAKLKLPPAWRGKTTRENKKNAIAYTLTLLEPEDIESLNQFKKKDDICDAFLHGYAYYSRV